MTPTLRVRLRQYRNRALLSLGAFALAVLVCEGVLWLVDFTYTPLSIVRRGGMRDYRREHAFSDSYFVHDPKLIWRPKKDYEIFNPQGFRGRQLAPKKGAKEFRIFAIGDSNTLGWSGKLGTSWPYSLQKLLTVIDREISVINAGVYGYTSYQGLQLLKEILVWKPDMVLISFGANDPHPVLIPDAAFRPGPFRSPIFRTRIGHLVIAAYDRLAAYRRNPGSQKPVPRVSLEQYRQYLNEMIRICKQNDIQCVLLTRPFLGTSDDPMLWMTYTPSYNAATIAVGKANGVPVIDVYSRFKDKAEFFADEAHFSNVGNGRAAGFICEHLKPLLPERLLDPGRKRANQNGSPP